MTIERVAKALGFCESYIRYRCRLDKSHDLYIESERLGKRLRIITDEEIIKEALLKEKNLKVWQGKPDKKSKR